MMYGADINIRNNEGLTPLDYATPELRKILDLPTHIREMYQYNTTVRTIPNLPSDPSVTDRILNHLGKTYPTNRGKRLPTPGGSKKKLSKVGKKLRKSRK
jgi:hypothetical protein